MTIDSTNAGNATHIETGRTGQTSLSPAGPGAARRDREAQSDDRVELSGFSGKVSEALRTDTQSRAEYVNQIAAAVRSGSYEIDPMAVGRAMIDEAISPRESQ